MSHLRRVRGAQNVLEELASRFQSSSRNTSERGVRKRITHFLSLTTNMKRQVFFLLLFNFPIGNSYPTIPCMSAKHFPTSSQKTFANSHASENSPEAALLPEQMFTSVNTLSPQLFLLELSSPFSWVPPITYVSLLAE